MSYYLKCKIKEIGENLKLFIKTLILIAKDWRLREWTIVTGFSFVGFLIGLIVGIVKY